VDERIRDHLQRLNRYSLLLGRIREISFEKFQNDEMLQASAERFLQLAIESCLNVGNRIISLQQFEKPIKPPETYADIFIGMESLGVIDKALRERLVQMARFRNMLVHVYWELDKRMVYEIIQQNLQDFRIFQDKVVDYWAKQEKGED